MAPQNTPSGQRRHAKPSRGDAPASRKIGAPAIAAAVSIVFLLLVGAGGMLWLADHRSDDGSGIESVRIGGPFTLVDGDGKTVTNAAWPGKYLLVYFGYTYCPDVCPTTLTAVGAALDRLGPQADRIQPLFITVDPRRDTPAVVKQYAAAFSPRLIGLTGTPQEIAQAAKEYHVYYAEHRTGPGPNDYSMDHSSILYLMAPDGKFITALRADESDQALASDISRRLASS